MHSRLTWIRYPVNRTAGRKLSSTAKHLSRVPSRVHLAQRKAKQAVDNSIEAKQYGDSSHIPVMLNDCMERLRPVLETKESVVLDCTFGGGGHTAALLDQTKATVYAIDRDPAAIMLANKLRDSCDDYRERLHPVSGHFGDMIKLLKKKGLKPGSLDAILMDIGPSSGQFSTCGRGFSFLRDEPLDMRMDVSDPNDPPKGAKRQTAAWIINNASQVELAYYFNNFAGEKLGNLYAKRVVELRQTEKILTTGQLVEALTDVTPEAVKLRLKDKMGRPLNLATRVFAALRMVVNDELGQLRHGLYSAAELLRPGGCLTVITFHSIESTMLKNFMKGKPLRDPPLFVNRHQVREAFSKIKYERSREGRFKPVTLDRLFEDIFRVYPDAAEVDRNPRARSAVLYAGRRTDAPVTSKHVSL